LFIFKKKIKKIENLDEFLITKKSTFFFFQNCPISFTKQAKTKFVQNNDHYLIPGCFLFHFANFVIFRIWLFPHPPQKIRKSS